MGDKDKKLANTHGCTLIILELSHKNILQQNLIRAEYVTYIYFPNQHFLLVLAPDNSGSAAEMQTKLTVVKHKRACGDYFRCQELKATMKDFKCRL